MSFIGGSSDFFGLDIGARSIRLVSLGARSGKFILNSFGSVQIPDGLALSEAKGDIQNLSRIISELVKKTQVDTKNVVSAIAGTSVFSSVVKMPPMTQSELDKAIEYQAEQNLPIKVSDAKYDWQVISQDPQTKELTIMIIATTKSKVNRMVELFEGAGLNILALETAAVAMSRSLSVASDQLVMILDIGATTTEIAVVDRGVLSLTRSFPVAGNAMTRAVAQNLSLDAAQAEIFKQKFGLSQDKLEGQVYKCVQPVMKNILEESIRSIKYYHEQTGRDVTRVVLTGGGSRLPLLSEYIKSFLNTEVVYGNPWARVSYQANLNDKVSQIGPEFATAIGLAMRG